VKRNNIELFRDKLQNLISAMEHREQDDFSRGILAVARTLKLDYDNLFSKQVWDTNRIQLKKLAEKYTTSDVTKCPICEGLLHQRKGKYGKFWGCELYPQCKGGRNMSGHPLLNDHMKLFLSEIIYKRTEQQHREKSNRFRIITENNA